MKSQVGDDERGDEGGPLGGGGAEREEVGGGIILEEFTENDFPGFGGKRSGKLELLFF